MSDGKLQAARTLDLLQPFVRLLAFAQDKRVVDWVVQFIFTHLMRQHKLGLEYQEKYRVWKEQGFAGSINQVQKVLVEQQESGGAPLKSGEMDPRAGRVDVELPPIPFNAKELAMALLHLKGDPRTSKRTRTQLALWATRFLKLHNGVYPLGLKKLPQNTRKRKRKGGDVDMNPTRAAKRLIRFEQRLMGKQLKKRRREPPPEPPTKKPRIEKNQIKGDWGVWHVSAAEPLKSPRKRVAKPPTGRKRVVINTQLNSSQNITEHIKQVQASPQPPWDSTRKPGKPLLKSPVRPSPINPFYKLRTNT